jgi:hypothetical protein
MPPINTGVTTSVIGPRFPAPTNELGVGNLDTFHIASGCPQALPTCNADVLWITLSKRSMGAMRRGSARRTITESDAGVLYIGGLLQLLHNSGRYGAVHLQIPEVAQKLWLL